MQEEETTPETPRERRRSLHFFHLQETKNLSWKTKISYTAPTMSTLPIVLLLAVYGTQFYELMGADLAYISFFIALARSFDVISDPLMSYLTDSFRSKYGRRRPFMITGCWVYSFLMVMLLSPPRWSPIAVSFWFGFFYVLFFLASTYTNIPYDALGPELTDNYEDRSRLFFVSGLFDGLGSLLAVLFPVMLSNYINFTTICPDPILHCMATGQGCYTIAGSEEYRMYDIGNISTSMVNEADCKYMTVTGASEECTSGLDCYCECALTCKNTCALENERQAYSFVGLFFAIWYCFTIANCVYQIKERCQLVQEMKEKEKEDAAPPPPMVPSMLNTLKNEPFKLLLPAWACDAVVNGIIASMMTYFVRYVIRPEYTQECKDGLDSWTCKSQLVLGACVTMLLIVAFLSTPIWLFINQRIGKRKAWLLWSATMAATNILFIFLGKGDVFGCIIITGINGLPFGAKFLADAILADIIDYDEFLTGARSEATYTMFKSFLPKICAIPASAIPIALLNTMGHIAPVNGIVQEQPGAVTVYVRIVAVILPTLISLMGFWIKLKFPFKTQAQVEMIAEGVGKHLLKQSGKDPVTGREVQYIHTTADEQIEMYRLDYFPSTKFLKEYIRCSDAVPNVAAVSLCRTKRKELLVVVLSLAFFLIVSINCFSLMSNAAISFIPVLSIIGVGVSLTACGFSALQYQAANDLLTRPVKKDILKKALLMRENVAQTHTSVYSPKTYPIQ